MKKTYEKPSADWISFQVEEDLNNSVGGTSGGVRPRTGSSSYQFDGEETEY